MAEYNKTKLHNVISVKSIATVFRTELSNHIVYGESHNFPEIVYVSQGVLNAIIEGENITVRTGQMIIYAPNTFHGPEIPSVVSKGTVEIISFETENELDCSVYNIPFTLTGEQRLTFSKIINTALPLFSKRIGVKGLMLKEDYNPYTLQKVKNMLELFLLDLSAPSKKYTESEAEMITDYMVRNINKTLKLQTISRELGISISTLKRVLQNSFNTTPIAYFSHLKIQEVKRLISHTPLSFTEIAFELGYSSVHHLSKNFKQKTGMTLTEYAKASRK